MIAAQMGQLKDLLGDHLESPITKFPDFEHLEGAGAHLMATPRLR